MMVMHLLQRLDGSIVVMLKNGSIEFDKFCVRLIRPIRDYDRIRISRATK